MCRSSQPRLISSMQVRRLRNSTAIGWGCDSRFWDLRGATASSIPILYQLAKNYLRELLSHPQSSPPLAR